MPLGALVTFTFTFMDDVFCGMFHAFFQLSAATENLTVCVYVPGDGNPYREYECVRAVPPAKPNSHSIA